jgi:phenylpropionate dioxygenase-like ring-hydroxylating dioxygenase large terminal subunit
MDAKSINEICAPLSKAKTLPVECYVNSDWYKTEIETIFEHDWLFVARLEEIPNKGDYITLEVVGRPILITNSGDGIVSAFYSICRHRGTLLTSGCGHTNKFVCPYHAWVYDLLGNLRGAPGMSHNPDFDRSEYGLRKVACKLWNKFIFINLSASPRDFSSQLKGFANSFERYKLEDLTLAHTTKVTLACNWKVFVENANESYHVDFVHKSSLTYAPGNVWTYLETDDTFSLFYGMFPGTLFLLAGEEPPFPAMQPGEDLSKENRHDVALLFPNTTFAGSTDGVMSFTVSPLGMDCCELTIRLLFPTAITKRCDYEQHLPRYIRRIDIVAEEDKVITELNYKGVKTGLHPGGRFHPSEFVTHRLAKFVVNRVSQ